MTLYEEMISRLQNGQNNESAPRRCYVIHLDGHDEVFLSMKEAVTFCVNNALSVDAIIEI